MNCNQTPRQILRSLLNVCFGLMLFGFGTYLTIQANLGTSPWDVFYIGICRKTGLQYGSVFALFSVCVILADTFLLKEKPGFGMLCSAVLIGKTVDLLDAVQLIPLMQGRFWIRVLVLLAGFWIEGFSQYFYMRAGLGFGAIDALQVGLSRRLPRMPIGAVNGLMLAAAFAAGALLGGPVGFATAVAPFAVSLLQQAAFAMMRFEPKAVHSQTLAESLCILLSIHRTRPSA